VTPPGDALLRRADAEARRAAKTEFVRPVAVEAGAGTGKTATLVARVLCWCLGPGWRSELDAAGDVADPERVAAAVLEGVVAITFTEAAAAEMISRVGAGLEVLARGALPVGVEAGDLDASPAELAERAGRLRAAIDRLDARTIHAFCRRLLAAWPLEAGVSPDFEIDADESRLEAVVREMLERELRDAWQEPVDPDLLRLASLQHGPPEVEATLLALVRAGARAADFAADPFTPAVARELAAGLRTALDAVLALDVDALQGASRSPSTQNGLDALAAAGAALERPVEDASSLARLTAELRKIVDGDAKRKLDEWRKKGPNQTETRILGARTGAFAERIRAFAEELRAVAGVDPELYECARRVVHRLLVRVERELDARGILSFDELIRTTRRLLEGRPDVASRVRSGIRQLLVDEFQDTDVDQCAILRALALTGPAGERPGLFLVGDPKQSIYAWRNADLAAYEGFVAEALAAGGERLPLVVNFRSTPEILEEVERLFTAPGVLVETPGLQPGFQRLLPAPGRRRARGGAGVEYWVTDVLSADTDREETYEAEARALARDVARVHEDGIPWSDIAVLFRSSSGVDTYLSALRDAGVPHEVRGDRSFYRRREVIDAANLVRAVLDPNDQVALVGFLRSPWVGVPDAALLPLWKAGLPREVALLRGPDPARLERLARVVAEAAEATPREVPGLDEVEGWPRGLHVALGSLARCRAALEDEPADVFVERLRAEFLPEPLEAARHLGAYRLANLGRFFRRVVAALDEPGDTQALLRTLRTAVALVREEEEARPGEGAQDAVAILTIHGSKGLDFGHVYLAQLHRRKRVSDDPTAFGRIDGRPEAVLFGARSPRYGRLLDRREATESAEYVRLLYVAATRAKDRLAFLSGWPERPAPKAWNDARAFVDLLQARSGALEALRALVGRRADGTAHVDGDGVLWRFADPAAAQESLPFGETPPALAGAERLAEDARRIAGARAAAEARMRRPFSGRASEEAHADLAEALAAGGSAAAARRGEAGRGVATAAGILVHLALERFDLAADPDAELARARDGLAELVRGLVPEADEGRASARARDILDRFRAGGLFARFTALRERVVARELPLLLPAGDGPDEPVGFVAGAIDLVHRDERGALVAVDYKTDAVRDADEARERARLYRSQGTRYAEALARALDLAAPPRFELWFLQAGIVEAVDASARPR